MKYKKNLESNVSKKVKIPHPADGDLDLRDDVVLENEENLKQKNTRTQHIFPIYSIGPSLAFVIARVTLCERSGTRARME